MIEVIEGDCLPIMQRYADKQFDLVITDPPYGIKAGGVLKSEYTKNDVYGAAKRNDYGVSDWDDFTPTQEYFDQILRVSKKQVIFGAQYFTDKLPPRGKWIVWDKKVEDKYSNAFSDCELAWTSEEGAVRIIRHLWHGMVQHDMKHKDERYHPTQKPLGVMRKLIVMFSEEGHTILDPFMGSGTTLRAAMDLHRDAVGIEINHKYAEIARMRLRQGVLL